MFPVDAAESGTLSVSHGQLSLVAPHLASAEAMLGVVRLKMPRDHRFDACRRFVAVPGPRPPPRSRPPNLSELACGRAGFMRVPEEDVATGGGLSEWSLVYAYNPSHLFATTLEVSSATAFFVG